MALAPERGGNIGERLSARTPSEWSAWSDGAAAPVVAGCNGTRSAERSVSSLIMVESRERELDYLPAYNRRLCFRELRHISS